MSMAKHDGADLAAAGTLRSVTREELQAESEAATAALEKMNAEYRGPRASDVPQDAVGSQQRITQLTNDPDFRTRLLDGDPAARKEFQSLTGTIANGSEADLALGLKHAPDNWVDSGSGDAARLTDQIKAVEPLRDAGHTDEEIRWVLEDKKVSGREFDAARRLQINRMNNAEWRAKLLAGDPDVTLEFNRISMILASEVDEALP
jgi:hypothetical protein